MLSAPGSSMSVHDQHVAFTDVAPMEAATAARYEEVCDIGVCLYVAFHQTNFQ